MGRESLEARLERLEMALSARQASYVIQFSDGSERKCDPIDAMIARLDAAAGAGPDIVSVKLCRGTERGLGSFVRIINGADENAPNT